MMNRIKSILSNFKGIDGYKIVEKSINSQELFFIRHDLDMNRAKDVHKFDVTVYRDFEEEGKKYRGSSTISIHPTMDDGEIRKAVEDAYLSAGYAKNEYYPLPKPCGGSAECGSYAPILKWIPDIVGAVFKCDTWEKGWLNSAELFLNNEYIRIVNSEGVDVCYKDFNGELEFITNWKEDREEVELYKHMYFADFSPDIIAGGVDEMLKMAQMRAKAKPTPSLKKFTVLLTGEPVKEFFRYYYEQASAKSVYEKISTARIGDNIQGASPKGDLISMRLDPYMKNSTKSRPYDDDGFPLKAVDIYKKGVLSRYWGDVGHSYYLGVEPTGVIRNMVVEGGTQSSQSFKASPYLELMAFSDFQMDTVTGDFAGEIRLGWYFDGFKTVPVSGGSISGNIRDVQGDMRLSSEVQQDDDFSGPKTIRLFNVSVSGAE